MSSNFCLAKAFQRFKRGYRFLGKFNGKKRKNKEFFFVTDMMKDQNDASP